jgi:hypothetical protein
LFQKGSFLLSTARPVILVILDGFGINPRKDGNAIANASMRNFDALLRTYPNSRLSMSGADVGLPDGQMGNSEVGHMILGAGRIVYQDLTLIHKDIDEGTFTRIRPCSRLRGEPGSAAGGSTCLDFWGMAAFTAISAIWRRCSNWRDGSKCLKSISIFFSMAAIPRRTAPSNLSST